MISFHKLILFVLLAVLPFAPAPVFAQAAGFPEGSASDLTASRHPGGVEEAYHPFIPAKLLKRLPAVVAAARSRTETVDAGRDEAMEELQQALGVGRTRLLNFCRILGEAGTRPWLMGDRLADISRRHGKLLARVKALSGRLISTGETRPHLLEELEAGNLARAYRLMEEASRSDQASATTQPAVAAALIHDLLGEIAQARLNYRQAADHFREAASLLPPDRTERRLFYLESAAYALFRQGDDYGDSEALAQSVDQYRGLALVRSRGKDPLSWGTAHHNLGTVLWVQGMREGSMPLLEESAEAFRAALLTRTRARVPLLWAASQQNLGNALSGLGRMSGNMSLLRQAATSHRAALEERSRDATPLEWAESQRALGSTLMDLARLQNDDGPLGEASGSLRAALEEIERERAPRAWALINYDLGLANYSFGALKKDRRAVEFAVQSYGDALREQTPERDPAEWAATQTSLGVALTALGMWEPGTARLEQAIEAFRNALTVRERERMPLDWARTRTSLAIALRGLALRQGKVDLFKEALDATREAHAVYMDAGMVHYEAYFTDRLVDWEAELAAIGDGAAKH